MLAHTHREKIFYELKVLYVIDDCTERFLSFREASNSETNESV